MWFPYRRNELMTVDYQTLGSNMSINHEVHNSFFSNCLSSKHTVDCRQYNQAIYGLQVFKCSVYSKRLFNVNLYCNLRTFKADLVQLAQNTK